MKRKITAAPFHSTVTELKLYYIVFHYPLRIYCRFNVLRLFSFQHAGTVGEVRSLRVIGPLFTRTRKTQPTYSKKPVAGKINRAATNLPVGFSIHHPLDAVYNGGYPVIKRQVPSR